MRVDRFFTAGILGDGLALTAGALLTLAFAPFKFFPLAILSPALLLGLWLLVSPRRAFLRGWLYGLGLFGTGVYWVFISIHTYGNTSIPVALFITGLFIMILGLFPAFTGYTLNRYFPNNHDTKILCAFPAIWILFDWIRSWICSGFPWLFIGYSQLYSPLKGFAPLLSVYGVSLMVLFSAALLVNGIRHAKDPSSQKTLLGMTAVVFALIWIAGGLLSLKTWTTPDGEPIKISLVQGNVAQDLKWTAEQIRPTLDLYSDLTAQHWDSKIIIWPESALPISMQDADPFLEEMNTQAKQHHTSIITGIPIEAPDTPHAYYNAIIVLGDGHGIYTKQRLVPFGEFIPLRNMVGKVFDILHIPMSNFIVGPSGLKPLQVDHLKIASFICYEIAFPEQVLGQDGDINMLLTISNDAWFGHSIAQAQHLEIAQMRAIELGRPVLFVSNNGITAFINADGKIQSAAPPFQPYVLTDKIQAMQGKTPWQRFKMDPVLFTVIILIFIAIRERHARTI